MNERIRDLAIETDVWCDQRYQGDWGYDIKWEHKFAELIVFECIKLAVFKGDASTGEAIKEHFGVNNE